MSNQTNHSPSLQPLPPQKMHKIVFSLLGVFGLIALTYPLAMFRVSRMEQFSEFQFHGKPLTPEYKAVSPVKTSLEK
ncbi:MAG: hypothetical protein AB4062_14770 [Crocosphaera sp.]